jgi:hypothetical protein
MRTSVIVKIIPEKIKLLQRIRGMVDTSRVTGEGALTCAGRHRIGSSHERDASEGPIGGRV